MALLGDAHVEVALGRHEMEVSRALLRDDLLEAACDGGVIQVLHLDMPVVDHLGLELARAAYLDGAHGYAEGASVAAHGLHYLHEPLALHAGAYLILQLRIELKLLHDAYYTILSA